MMNIPANTKYAIILETSQRTDNLLGIKQLCSLAGASRCERYQWNLACLAPAEHYRYLMTGKYPLSVPPPKINR